MASSQSSPLPTKAVYQIDESLRTHLTRTEAVHRYSDLDATEQPLFKAAAATHDDLESCYAIETQETIFYAQGGGQPYDTGYMSIGEMRFDVEAVRSGNNGKILHFGTFKADGERLPSTGDMVEQHVDGKRRDMNSRSHTGGHIIGLSVRRLIGGEKELESVTELKASHYPDASFVEFQGLIDGKFKDAIQTQATEFVKQALPIKLDWYKPEDLGEKGVITADGMPIVAGPDGNVRVVDIVGAGAYPCGGTHVQDTSLVGNIVVKGIKRQKGISKISYTIS